MDHAWLDSLSEDWVSQPGSAHSLSDQAASLPSSLNGSVASSNNDSMNSRKASSRIPLSTSQQHQNPAVPRSSSPLPLAERSLLSQNILSLQRGIRQPSKLRDESIGNPGCKQSRSNSASSGQSINYDTVHHKLSPSPEKERYPPETPEWKRRLLNGDVAYGEKRDLFSPVGLENIFKPPPQDMSKRDIPSSRGTDMVMPSSPPPFPQSKSPPRSPSQGTQPKHEEKNKDQESMPPPAEKRGPKAVRYNVTEAVSQDFSENDLSASSSFRQPALNATHSARDSVMTTSAISPKTVPTRIPQPAPKQHNLTPNAARMVSGQSDTRHEGLSPIFVARQNTEDGDVDFEALDMSAGAIQKRLRELGGDSSVHIQSPQVSGNGEASGSEGFARNGRYVSTGRDENSAEGLYQRRMLSPSSLGRANDSTMLQDASVEASTPKNSQTFLPSNNIQPGPQVGLQTPKSSPLRPPAPGNNSRPNSASPLKLFGNHDTFTTEMLSRRLSQFEQSFTGPFPPRRRSGEANTILSEINEAFIAPTSPIKGAPNPYTNEVTRNITRFGDGALDQFRFSEEITPDLSRSIHSDSMDESRQDLPVLDPTSQTNFRFTLEPSPNIAMVRNRTKSINGSITKQETKTIERIYTRRRTRSSSSSPSSDERIPEPLNTPRRRNGDVEGKRLLKTPLKDPTPKRRRTLHKSDISHLIANADATEPLRETHQHMQSMIGRKRIESTHHDLQIADPAVMAKRHVLRPRTPTPSQRSRSSRPATTESNAGVMMNDFGQEKFQQQQRIAQIQAEIDAVETESKASSGKHMMDESRKNSVTTQDFLDEAKAIMAGIRGKTKRRSGLSSVQESESDQNAENDAGDELDDLELEDSFQDSTQERFSRPPSREGRPAVAHLPREQQDPDLLSHLKQYEEGHSDMEEVIASSLRSIRLAHEATEADEKLHDVINQATQRLSIVDERTESEPANIRITESPEMWRKRKHSDSSANGQEGGYTSQGSGGSSGPPTSRSIQTTSSSGSASRLMIAPHTVSHLIPEELAGMAFDRERNMWVKRKSVSSEVKDPEIQEGDESEDDPFGSIPDLSVDMTEELLRIQAVAARKKAEAREAHIQQLHSGEDHFYHDLHTIEEQNSSSTQPKDVSLKDTKPTETKPSPKTSKNPQSSWDRDYETQLPGSFSPIDQPGQENQEFESEVSSPVDFEISVLEDRVQEPIRHRRNVTISFSSPVASVIRDNDQSMHEEYPDTDDESKLDLGIDDIDQIFEDESFMEIPQNQRQRSSSLKSSFRGSTRRFPMNGHPFEARPISTIDEQDEEDSFIQNLREDKRRNVSVVISTPVPSRNTSRQLSVGLGSSVQRYDYGSMLDLTPMSDFTMHNQDESFALEVSQIAYQRRQANDGKKTLALSVKQLVERITDVEPYEPFWRHLKQLGLKDQRLDGLHKLNEFCGSLEDLDASRNQISQLDGTPASVRNLRMTHNLLNDLASWSHLMNLQYVDISHNNITTLNGFKRLIHLRGLRADNNKITSLDGITHLDGLQTLRLRNNLISTVDLAGTALQRLTDLDLRSNCVNSITDIQELRSLTTLNLEDNKLTNFTISESSWALKYLRVSGNSLTALDVSLFPNLRLLYADRNNLGKITGLLKAKYLDSLSLREQNAPLDMSFLSRALEVRKMFLSGNYLQEFKPTVDFLNLQYLEMANCGLESLPEDFGEMLGNLRVLNLNMNALSEITPLLGIVRLKKLYLAGNRIVRLRRTATVFSQFSSLTKLDLRNNPLTLGFYPPVYEKRLMVRDADDEEEQIEGEPFTIPLADEMSDRKYTDRLDMGTRMRRRVYELLILGGRRIRVCDGLKVGPLDQADAVWESLVREGVVCGEITATENVHRGRKVEGNVREDSERWQAEDSFA